MPRTLLVAALALASCKTQPATRPGTAAAPSRAAAVSERAQPPVLPRSEAYDVMRDGVVIVIGRSFAALGDRQVARVIDGRFPTADMRGYEVAGLVEPLAAEAARLETDATARGEAWTRNAVLLLDEGTRFGALVEVIYTANQRGFTRYQLAVDAHREAQPGTAALDLDPPKYVNEGGATKLVHRDRPHVGIRILEDRVRLTDHARATTELTFDDADLAHRGKLLEWATAEAKALRLATKELPLVVVTATSAITVSRLVAVLSTVSGPECGPTQKQQGDAEQCLFAHRIIEASGETPADAPKATVKGALDKDVIRRVVRANLGIVSACYNTGLHRDPTLRGRVKVQFTIGPTGAVIAAAVLDTELADAEVGECIAKATRHWKFPAPKGGGKVVITYPFLLETGPPAAGR